MRLEEVAEVEGDPEGKAGARGRGVGGRVKKKEEGEQTNQMPSERGARCE